VAREALAGVDREPVARGKDRLVSNL